MSPKVQRVIVHFSFDGDYLVLMKSIFNFIYSFCKQNILDFYLFLFEAAKNLTLVFFFSKEKLVYWINMSICSKQKNTLILNFLWKIFINYVSKWKNKILRKDRKSWWYQKNLSHYYDLLLQLILNFVTKKTFTTDWFKNAFSFFR
jgi:hypothetical protein